MESALPLSTDWRFYR